MLTLTQNYHCVSRTSHQHYLPNGPFPSRPCESQPLYKIHHPTLRPVQTLPIIPTQYLDPRLKLSTPIPHQIHFTDRHPSTLTSFTHSFDSHLSHSLPSHSLPLLRHSVPVKSVSAENCTFIGRDTVADVLAFLNAQSTKDFMNLSFAYRETFDSPTHDYSMWQTRYDQRSGYLSKAQSLRGFESRNTLQLNRSTTEVATCASASLTKKVDPFDPYPDIRAVNKSRRLADDIGLQIGTKSLSRRDSIPSITDGVRSVVLNDSCKEKRTDKVVPTPQDKFNSKKVNSKSKSNNEHDSASGSDEVFKKIAIPLSSRSTRFSKRRTSSLDAKPTSNRNPSQSSSSHPIDCRCDSCSANARSNEPPFSSDHKNYPNRPSTTTTTNSRRPSTSGNRRQNSGYDSRERGRGREMYRDSRHRGGGGGSDRENEASLSDRDQRSDHGSFNRSMSNAEGTPDDKIGKSSQNISITNPTMKI